MRIGFGIWIYCFISIHYRRMKMSTKTNSGNKKGLEYSPFGEKSKEAAGRRFTKRKSRFFIQFGIQNNVKYLVNHC